MKRFKMLFPTYINGFGMNLIKVPDEDRSQVVCTIALLHKYFHSGETLSGSILSMSITSASLHVQQILLVAIHKDVTFPWTMVIKNSHQDSTAPSMILHEKPQCYFAIVENLEDEDLEDIFEDWKTTVNWNPLAQFVVYLSSVEETDEEMTELMVEILLSFMNKKIYNINVIGQNEENGFFYGKTVFPYHPDNNCGNRVIAIETLDICDYQEAEKNDDDDDYEDDGQEEKDELEDDMIMDDEKNNETEDAAEKKSQETDEKISSIEGQPQTVNENDGKLEASEENKSQTANRNDDEKDENITGQYTDEAGNKYNPQTDNKMDSKKELNNVKNKDIEDNLQTSDGNGIEQGSINKESNNSFNAPKVYLQELYRALFLDKFPKDLSGCPLTAAYRPWEPYIFIEVSDSEEEGNVADYEPPSFAESADNVDADNADEDNDIDDSGAEIKLTGIEYQMVKTIAERLHISIDLQIESNNLYHLFQQLIDGDIEMVVGGIDEDPSISQFVSSTIPYHQDDLTWCVAKAKRKYNLFNFLESFKMSTWALTLTFVLTTSVNILFTQKLLHLRSSLSGYFGIAIRILGIVLTQSLPIRNIPLTLKLSFGTAFFMGLMFSNVYQSFLVSTLTTPKSSYQISHLEEIYRNRMTVTGSVENVRHLNKEGEVFKYIREKFQMCYNIEECLSQAAKDEKIAVAVSRQHVFYNPRIPRDQLYCFNRDENLYVYLVTMLLPKKFHLLHKINPVIQHIIESGHMQKWARDLDMKRKIYEEIHRVKENSFKSLTLAQVGGSFVLSVMLLSIALFVFLLECCVFWMVMRRRTRLKFLKLLHRKFR